MPTDSLLIVSVLVFNMNLKHTLKTIKSYSYINTSFSDDTVFQKLRLGTYFQILKKLGKDIGVRYTQTIDNDIYASVIGIGKYIGSYWLNLRSYLQINNKRS
jgi:hypothetical protein